MTATPHVTMLAPFLEGFFVKAVEPVEAILFPEPESQAFWFVPGAMLLFSGVGFFFHFAIVKRWPTVPPIDRFIEMRRTKLVEAYFGNEENGEERNALFFGAPAAAGSGLFGMGSLVIKLAPEESDAALMVICLLFVVGIISFFVLSRRRRSGPPERIKPSWLIEEEKKRESAGEIVRHGRGWEKNPRSHD